MIRLVGVIAVLTMTTGNVLGLMQHNVKRVLACSSIAHSGYMLVGVTALLSAREPRPLAGVLFYLASYGIMNVAAFGVLMLLPSRGSRPATSAETFEDLAGTGRDHVVLGLAMAVACFSLTGLPFTIGFWGKAYLIFPALRAGNTGLVVFMMINAAISAGYYLKIVGVMFLRPQPQGTEMIRKPAIHGAPIAIAVALSSIGTLMLGVVIPTTELLRTQTLQSIDVDSPPALPAASAQP
jgi:NADH-quinone oxidoreductase subunit N